MDRRPLRHGTRHTYKAGCRCLPCRRAEAVYRSQLRRLKAKGHRPLGMRVSATRTWRRIRALLAEEFSKAEIARRLGWKKPEIQIRTVITVQTEARVEAFYQALMAEGPDIMTKR